MAMNLVDQMEKNSPIILRKSIEEPPNICATYLTKFVTENLKNHPILSHWRLSRPNWPKDESFIVDHPFQMNVKTKVST